MKTGKNGIQHWICLCTYQLLGHIVDSNQCNNSGQSTSPSQGTSPTISKLQGLSRLPTYLLVFYATLARNPAQMTDSWTHIYTHWINAWKSNCTWNHNPHVALVVWNSFRSYSSLEVCASQLLPLLKCFTQNIKKQSINCADPYIKNDD